MAFNPLQNFLGGQQAGRQQQAFDIAGRLSQSETPQLEPEFQRLMQLDPAKAKQFADIAASGDAARANAMIKDAKSFKWHLQNGNTDSARELLINRSSAIGGRPSQDTDELRNILDTKGPEAAIVAVDGFLGLFDPNATKVSAPSVQSSKILEDGTIIQVMKGGKRQVISSSGKTLTGDEAKDAVKESSRQSHERKIELARLGQTIKREQARENLLTTQQTDIQRSNIQRLGALSSTATGRNSAIKKATKFKLALQNGEVRSGAGRKAASFVPGVFTSQGQFDEEFNAFAEVAARQQLKASGETRPTDADVQGMKQAMFGLGRDESVNVQLLTDFIKDNQSQTQELDQLIEASKGGNLSSFTFTNSSSDGGKRLEDMTIEELEALRSGGGQ